jgi:phosphohistidine phosphatase
MKTVYIVRHAKSTWDNYDVADHDRTLMPVGIKKTKKIIDFFNSKKVEIDLIISSSAVRAFETSKLIAEGIGFDSDKIVRNKALYNAGVEDVYNELFSIDNSVNSVMIVAHNPTLTDFVNEFVVPEIMNLPTTGAVCVSFNTDSWENIVNAKFSVNFVVFPRMLS